MTSVVTKVECSIAQTKKKGIELFILYPGVFQVGLVTAILFYLLTATSLARAQPTLVD